MVEASDVKAALKKRKAYIHDNLDSLTSKKTRRLLEEDLQLSKGDLDEHKDLITETLDKMLGSLAGQEPSSSKVGDDAEAANGAPAKKAKTKHSKESPERPAKAPSASKGDEDPRVQKLKRVCQQAGILVGPHLYKQSDRVAAFTTLLEQHGLHAKSTPDEIKAVKAERDAKKELEGIDTSNIISGGRRRGARAAAPPPAAAAEQKKGSCAKEGSDDDDDDDDESDDDDFGGGDSSSDGGGGGASGDGEGSGGDDSDAE